MKKNAPILVIVIAAIVAIAAYYYFNKAESGAKKPAGVAVSWAEKVPDEVTDEQITAFVDGQKDAAFDDKLKASTQFAYEHSKGRMEEEAAQLLIKVLDAQSIQAQSWTVIAPKGEKIAVTVKTENGTFKYLDPHDGVVAVFQGQAIIGPYAARFLMSGGHDRDKVFQKLDDASNLAFYDDFAHVMMAPPGNPVYVNIAAPVFDEPLVLGELNNDSDDVAESASEEQLTPYINYIGRKHGEMVTRKIFFTDPAQVTMVLTKPYDAAIMTANIEPMVDGNSITFKVPQDEPLILNDLSDDFIDVDQLIIKPL
jgi:hypothetical protein